MANPTLDELHLAEKQQRTRLEGLRARLYAQPALAQEAAFSTQLLAAEEAYRRLEEARLNAEAQAAQGVLMQVKPPPNSQFLGPGTTGIEATVLLRQSHVPLGVVHLLEAEKNPLVSFRIRYLGDVYTRVRVSSFVEEYSAKAITTVELDRDNPEREIKHLPTFFPERIRTVAEITRATLHIQIDDLDKTTEQENTFPIWLLARTSAYLWVTDPANKQRIDLTHLMGAWVTPNAEEVLLRLRRAADFHPEKKIIGYQGDAEEVEAQVKAIYEALQEQQIQYVNSTLCLGASRGERMQRIRLPREALETKSANCIDGTVLMASLLEAASLNPAIVLLPGHALLGWERAEGSNDWDYLETTMISTSSFEEARQAGQLQVRNRATRLLPLSELRLVFGVTPME